MSKDEALSLVSKINWDYDYPDEELLNLIEKKGDSSRIRLMYFIKSLETFTWQELISVWGLEECNALYTDSVRKGIFLDTLREQYDGVFELLRNKTLSHTERSAEELERFKSTLLFNRRNRIKQRVF